MWDLLALTLYMVCRWCTTKRGQGGMGHGHQFQVSMAKEKRKGRQGESKQGKKMTWSHNAWASRQYDADKPSMQPSWDSYFLICRTNLPLCTHLWLSCRGMAALPERPFAVNITHMHALQQVWQDQVSSVSVCWDNSSSEVWQPLVALDLASRTDPNVADFPNVVYQGFSGWN